MIDIYIYRDKEFIKFVEVLFVIYDETNKVSEHIKKTIEECEDHLSKDNPRLRYYGGFGFNQEAMDVEWKGFGCGDFVIPQFELFVEKENLVKLEDNNYFIHDLIGSKVFQHGEEIGEIWKDYC